MSEQNVEIRTVLERIGYLCVQGYPKRVCSGCTSGCREPVFAYPESQYDVTAARDIVEALGEVLDIWFPMSEKHQTQHGLLLALRLKLAEQVAQIDRIADGH